MKNTTRRDNLKQLALFGRSLVYRWECGSPQPPPAKPFAYNGTDSSAVNQVGMKRK